MKNATVLDLMKSNYNIENEVVKLNYLFFEAPMFREMAMFQTVAEYSYETVFNKFLLRKWKFRQTYVSVKDIMMQNGFDVNFDKKFSNEQLIQFLELIDNILCTKSSLSMLERDHSLFIIQDTYKFMLEIVDSLIKNLGLIEKENPDGWIVLIPQNEALDKVIEGYKPAVQWSIVSYMKLKKDDLDGKRKHLAYLATELYIEKDDEEKGYQPFDIVMNECTLILNNLQIRHNNETGKWENEVVKTIDKGKALILCDMLYNKMLQIALMRKDLNNQSLITNFSKSLKSKK